MRSISSVAALFCALAVATAKSSDSSSASSTHSRLDFDVPLPIKAPGTNTSSGCGTRLDSDWQVGSSEGPFTFNTTDGYGREYAIYIPEGYDINTASPLIFALAGNTNTYADIEDQTRLSTQSMNPYAIAVFVSGYQLGFVSNPGYGATWDATYPKVDDLSFMNDFIQYLESKLCVDTGRVWAVGHSNGGGLTNVMACDPTLSTKVSVFAANSGAFYTNSTDGNPDTISTDTTVQKNCSPGRDIIPYIEFHGTADATIAYNGSDEHDSYGVRVLPSIPHWAAQWSVRNGYGTDNVTSHPQAYVTVYQWGPSDNLGVVTHYRLAGWIHDFARKSAGAPIDAMPIMMQFFYNQTNFTGTETTSPTSSGSPTSTSPAEPTRTSSPALAVMPGVASASLFSLMAALFAFI